MCKVTGLIKGEAGTERYICETMHCLNHLAYGNLVWHQEQTKTDSKMQCVFERGQNSIKAVLDNEQLWHSKQVVLSVVVQKFVRVNGARPGVTPATHKSRAD